MAIVSNSYFEELNRRSKKSRVHHRHQLIGLEIAEILSDRRHKSLYIKLAKKYDPDKLLELAKTIAQNPRIANKGAYFMRVISQDKSH